MSLLDYNNKFNIEIQPKLKSELMNDNCFRATSPQFYRTSYNNMSSKVITKTNLIRVLIFSQNSVERKNCAIPGYKGFVPGHKNGSLIG